MSKEDIKKIELEQNVFWKDEVIWYCISALFLFMAISWALWIYFYRQTSVPVGMPVYFGFLQSNPIVYTYILPIFGSVLAFFHLIIAYFAYNRDRLISYFMLGGMAFLEILILTTVVYYMIYT